MKRGTEIASGIVKATVDGDGINDGIIDAFDDAGNNISDKGKEHGEDYGDGFDEGFFSRIKTKLSDRISTSLNRGDSAGRAGDEAGESFVDRMSEKVRDLGDKVTSELSDRIASNPEGVRRGINRAFDDDFADRIGDRLGDRIALSMSEAIDRQSGSLSEALDRAVSGNGRGGRGGREGGIGAVIGRLFGAGSRNNALNLIGKSIGGIVSLTEKAAKFAGAFSQGMASAAEGAGLVARLSAGFGSAGIGLTGAFATLAASAPILAIALGAVLLVASALVSVLGALLAIVIALSATIVSALVGALAVAGPLLGAFIAGAGLLTAAFTSMTEAQRKYLTDAFEPFHQAITGVGQIIFTQFTKPLYDGQSAIQIWSNNLSKALVPLAGVASKTAKSFADAGNTITASLSGPGFQKFFDSLGRELPSIIANLSGAFGKFLNGVGALFAAIMPSVTRFTEYLQRVATDFSKWANSGRGQNSIKDFVDRAIESLKSFWGFLKEVGGLLSDLLFNRDAQKTGNGMFDDMTKELQRFRDYLKKQDLKKWFEDARAFGKKAWKVVKDFVDLITDLYEDGTLDAVGDGLTALGDGFKFIDKWGGTVVTFFKTGLPDSLNTVLNPIQTVIDKLADLASAIRNLPGIPSLKIPSLGGGGDGTAPALPSTNPYTGQNPFDIPDSDGRSPFSKVLRRLNGPGLEALQQSGADALANTLEEHGGHMADPDKGGKSGGKDGVSGNEGKKDKKGKKFRAAEIVKEWLNPYIEWAAILLSESDNVAAEIEAATETARAALRFAIDDAAFALQDLVSDLGKTVLASVSEAAKSLDAGAVADSFAGLIETLVESSAGAMADAQSRASAAIGEAAAAREQMVAAATAAYQNAVSAVASATTKKQADKALIELKKAEANLALANERGRNLVDEAQRAAQNMLNNAAATQGQIWQVNQMLSQQAVLNFANVTGILAGGVAYFNASLADWAEARRIVAERLEVANQKLLDALSLRDSYSSAVADSVRSFGSLLTAQAKTLNGVQQALTAGDITDNLSARLSKIKTFQENLRLLLANGLSDDAYKQLVDAGVETGGAYAEAILQGGQGSISEVNSLTEQIGQAADGLGTAAASHLYQAGVDAAQGLVDGLNSLSTELETAATALGNSIAQAIRAALGIRSPSRVLINDMKSVGDGVVVGLDNQHVKVSAAAARLSEQIRVSPEVAAYAAQQANRPTTDEEVSGNGDRPAFLWTGDIVTPTEDPEAVVNEVMNELTGRLP